MSSVLDIGVGQNPYFFRYETHCDADEYVGVDKCNDCLVIAKHKANTTDPKIQIPAKKDFVVGSAVGLPFQDASFKYAVLANVISAPIHKNWDTRSPNYTAQGFGEKDAFYRERSQVVEEALRVLEPAGKLLIYTDILIYGHHSYTEILNKLQNTPGLKFETLKQEQMRIDALNLRGIATGKHNYSFLAEVLPNCSVFEITKLRKLQ